MRKSFIFSIFLLLFLSFVSVSFAQETSTVSAVSTPRLVPEYMLPYPGILPDNPLYSLKTLRDRIISFLIADSLKKSEFDLFQADKRLSSGVALLKKGENKEQSAYDTISKGENYFYEAISKVKKAKQEGKEVKDIIEKLTRSQQKHETVLKELEGKSTSSMKGNFASLRLRVAQFAKEVAVISKQ